MKRERNILFAMLLVCNAIYAAGEFSWEEYDKQEVIASKSIPSKHQEEMDQDFWDALEELQIYYEKSSQERNDTWCHIFKLALKDHFPSQCHLRKFFLEENGGPTAENAAEYLGWSLILDKNADNPERGSLIKKIIENCKDPEVAKGLKEQNSVAGQLRIIRTILLGDDQKNFLELAKEIKFEDVENTRFKEVVSAFFYLSSLFEEPY